MPDVADRLLAERLAGLGMPPYRGVVTHTNRMVMLSVTPGGILRIHRGYAHAPDRVLKAIVRFLKRGTRRAARREAEREFLAFPVEKYAPPTRPARRIERPRPDDAVLLLRLEETHRRLNAQHFNGRLRGIRFRLSGRMRTRLGELAMDATTLEATEIALNRKHFAHGWDEVERTVLHEMVHQWQAEQGLPVNHGAVFRAKAREVGAEPAARRRLPQYRRPTRERHSTPFVRG